MAEPFLEPIPEILDINYGLTHPLPIRHEPDEYAADVAEGRLIVSFPAYVEATNALQTAIDENMGAEAINKLSSAHSFLPSTARVWLTD